MMKRSFCIAVAAVLSLNVTPFAASPDKPAALATAVLKARCQDVAQKTGERQVMAAIDVLAHNPKPAADEALAMLNGFYLGEQPSLRIAGAMMHRDKKKIMLLLDKYTPASMAIPAPCKAVLMEPRMRELAYEYLKGTIE